jgi:hypothetical protein
MRKVINIISPWKVTLLFPLLFFFALSQSYAMDVTLEWDANTEPDLDGYKVYYDTDSGHPYDGIEADEGDSGEIEIDKNTTTITLHGLPDGQAYYFAVTAYDTESLESEYSNEVATSSASTPIVTGETLTNTNTPTWSWSSGGGGNGTFRYKLDDDDLTSGATETTDISYTPATALSEGSHTLYVQEQDNDGYWSSTGSFTIVIDTIAPTSSATALDYGNGTFSLTWTASDATSGVASTQLWYKDPGGTWADSGLDAQTGTSGTFSYSPTGEEEVEEGTYYFATRSTDNADNVEEEPSGDGDISYTVTTTEPTPGGDNADGGGCFIATAAFGSHMDRHVKSLSQFRDKRLANNYLGERFIALYNEFSPPLADFLRRHPFARIAVRYSLLPISGVAYVAISVHPVVLLLGFILLLLTGVYCFKHSSYQHSEFSNKRFRGR